MNDAITAANMINNALFMRDMGDTLVGLQARRDYQGEIAHLRAWLEWYERQRVALVALSEEAIRVGKAELAKSECKISALDRENQELRRKNDALQLQRDRYADLYKASDAANEKYSTQLARVAIHGMDGLKMPDP
jgi:hypothetical protein